MQWPLVHEWDASLKNTSGSYKYMLGIKVTGIQTYQLSLEAVALLLVIMDTGPPYQQLLHFMQAEQERADNLDSLPKILKIPLFTVKPLRMCLH